MVDSLRSSSLFNLTEAISLFNYLTISAPRSRVLWYRTIMRILTRFHHEYRRYATEQEIQQAVSTELDTEYNIEQCKEDLEFLRTNGNVTVTQDFTSVNSVAEFHNRRLLYQATPEAIAIENFLESQVHQQVRVGALDQSNLKVIHDELKVLDENLIVSAAPEQTANVQILVEQWERIFDLWRTVEKNAALYVDTIALAAQQGGVDLESYLAYKHTVVQYVYRFAEALLRFGYAIYELLSGWSMTEKKEQLITMIARHRYGITPNIQDKDAFIAYVQEARSQVDAITRWFAPNRETEMFRRRAGVEVEHVVRRASSLALLRRSPLDYVNQLQTLAQIFTEVQDVETAQHIYTIAFANALPMHFSETIFGPVGVTDRTQQRGMWEQQPLAHLKLWSIGQKNPGERISEEPMLDQRTKIRQLKVDAKKKTEKQQQRLTTLFATHLLDIGTLVPLDEEGRRLLEEILDACLIDPQNQYKAQDGTTVTLLNKDKFTRVALVASDGILRLPHYRLLYQKLNS